MIFLMWILNLFVPVASAEVYYWNQYSVFDLIREYLEMPVETPKEIKIQEYSKEISDIHYQWVIDYNNLITRFPRVPEIEGKRGVLYQSDVYFDKYQNRLKKTYDLTIQINDQLNEALSVACKVCMLKQRLPFVCPTICATKM